MGKTCLPDRSTSVPCAPPTLLEETTRHVRALYDFSASRSDEMDLRRGAVYTVIAERGQWLVGEDDSGTQRGEFPRSYVEHGAVLAHFCSDLRMKLT